MTAKVIEFSSCLFFIEYFFCIIFFYVLIVYLLLIGNVLGILIYKILSNCLSFVLLLLIFLLLNDCLFFLIDLNHNLKLFFLKTIIFDYFSTFGKFSILFLSCLFFIIVVDLLKDYELTSLEFFILLIFNILGLLILCSSQDLLLIFLSMELIGLSSYFLTAYKKNSLNSIECGIKYLIVGAISSIFFLFGCFLFYFYLASVLLQDIRALIINIDFLFFNISFSFLKKLVVKFEYYRFFIQCFNLKSCFLEYLLINNFLIQNNKPVVELGFLFICISVFIKISIAPFHNWSLNIYENSVSIVVFFFIVVTKLSYFICLFRIYFCLVNKLNSIFNFFFMFIGFLSVVVGSFSNLKQKKLKSLLTYSSISHMGYIILSFSIKSTLGLEIIFFYISVYLFSSVSLWFSFLTLRKKTLNYNTKLSKNINDLTLLNKSNKIISFNLLLVLFSMSGLPPLIGFFAKMGIFFSLILCKFFTVTFATIFCGVISTFYYIRLIKILYFENFIVGKLFYPLYSPNLIIFNFISFELLFLFLNPKLLYLNVHKTILFNCCF